MPLEIKCDRCLKGIDEPGALVFSPPSDDGRVEKLHICKICWIDTRQGIMLHRRFMNRDRSERCPESDFPAPNDIEDDPKESSCQPEGMTYGPVLVDFNQQVTKRDGRDMTIIERVRSVFEDTLTLPSPTTVLSPDQRLDFLVTDIDELDRVELAMSIEEEFGSKIDDGEEDKWQTIGDILEFLNKNGIKDDE